MIVPTHNVRPWIRETLGTVLAQRDGDMEVIVVDDHSTDGTVEIIEDLARANPALRLVTAAVRGGGSARNEGVAQARGRYLIFCDGDDLVPDGAYAALVESLEASGSDIAFGDFLKFSPTETWRPTAAWPAYSQGRTRFTAEEVPSILYGRACWNKAFRRTFWDRSGAMFPDVPRSNDIVPMTMCYLAASAIDMVDDIVYLYRERQGATSMSSRAANAESLLSYFEQELACADLVAAAESSELSTVFSSLVLDRDGWVHLARYLRESERRAEDDERVRAVLARLVSASGHDVDDIGLPHKRLVFTLALAGEFEAAAGLARVTSGPPSEIADQLTSWIAFLTATSRAGTAVLREEPWLVRLVAEMLAAAVVEGSDETDRLALDLASIAILQDTSVLEDVPELHGFTGADAADRTTAFAAARRAAASVIRVGSGRRLELMATQGAETRGSLVLFDPDDGSIVTAPGTSTADGRAFVRFPARAIPAGTRFVIAHRDDSSGAVHAARFATAVPAYDRFDRFEVLQRRTTLEIRRRRHWVSRAAAKGVMLLRRRFSTRSTS